jgi:hypothetical protein
MTLEWEAEHRDDEKLDRHDGPFETPKELADGWEDEPRPAEVEDAGPERRENPSVAPDVDGWEDGATSPERDDVAREVRPSADLDAVPLPEGWAMVPLSRIDTSKSGVTGPGDFTKGYSTQDLEWAYGALNEVVLPGLAEGRDPDYFAQLDAGEGRLGARSYSDTYQGFLGGDDTIKLDARPDGTYDVTNGYHRLWVAQRMGLSSVPARVR